MLVLVVLVAGVVVVVVVVVVVLFSQSFLYGFLFKLKIPIAVTGEVASATFLSSFTL